MGQQIRLFVQRDVDDEWTERRKEMERKCAHISDDEILSTDLQALSERIAKPFFFDLPEVHVDQVTRDEPVFSRGNDTAVVRFYIPVKGDATILGYHHRTRPLSPQYSVTVENGVLQFQATPRRDRITDAKATLDDVLKQIAEYLPEVMRVLKIYNPRFVEFAKNALQARYRELMENQKATHLLSTLGIPIRKRADEVSAVYVPVTRKQIQIPDSPKQLEHNPHIAQQVYDDILQTISAVAHGIPIHGTGHSATGGHIGRQDV